MRPAFLTRRTPTRRRSGRARMSFSRTSSPPSARLARIRRMAPPTCRSFDRDSSSSGFAEPLTAGAAARAIAERGAVLVAMELVPRITRAQSMDALSSMATIVGYKAVSLAADTLPRMFPMLNTAAGTVAAARVFVVGAGVAGLQAIATARRLGARVEAYDVRPAVKEQIQSLGARFVELPIEAVERAGHRRIRHRAGRVVLPAPARDDDEDRRERPTSSSRRPRFRARRRRSSSPARWSPRCRRDRSSSILAAERGGNCELTVPDETVVRHGVTILGPTNLAASVPYHASQMYARNVVTLIQHLVQREKGADGKASGPPRLVLNMDDEITKEIVVTKDGTVVHAARARARGGQLVVARLDSSERRRAGHYASRASRQHQDHRPHGARRFHRGRRAHLAPSLPAHGRQVRSARGRRPGLHERHDGQRQEGRPRRAAGWGQLTVGRVEFRIRLEDCRSQFRFWFRVRGSQIVRCGQQIGIGAFGTSGRSGTSTESVSAGGNDALVPGMVAGDIKTCWSGSWRASFGAGHLSRTSADSSGRYGLSRRDEPLSRPVRTPRRNGRYEQGLRSIRSQRPRVLEERLDQERIRPLLVPNRRVRTVSG